MAAPARPAVEAFWSPDEIRDREAEFCRLAGAALAPAVELPLSTWAEQHIVLPPTDPIPGPLDLSRAPHLAGWLDLMSNPAVTEVTAVTSAQIGKSLGLICLIAYCVAELRVPVLVVREKQPTAKSFNRTRVQPVFRASPKLRELLPAGGRGNTDYEVLHTNGVRVRYAGAGSPADLAESSVPVVVFDEFDKYQIRGKVQSNQISEGSKRTAWWLRTLVVKTTTPTIEKRPGQRELNRAECQLRYYVPCPHCGAEQILQFAGEKEGVERGGELLYFPGPAGRVDWPRNERGHALHSPDQIEAKGLAYYVCGACGAVWTEAERWAAVSRGRWRTLDGQPPAGHVGLHYWEIGSPRSSFSKIAAAGLEAELRPDLQQNFVNLTLGRIYKEAGAKPSFEVALSRRREGYRMGQVPAGVRFLTFFCDVHSALQYWQVWGWGLGFTGWLVAAGREDTAVDARAGWRRVFEAATREYPVVPFGNEQPQFPTLRVGQFAGIALIDSGWAGTGHDPEENVDEAEVLELCDAWNWEVRTSLFHPAKGGSSAGQIPPLQFSRTAYTESREGKPLRDRLQLHVFNPWVFKKWFHSRLGRSGEVGGFWLPQDLPDLFVRQMLAEEMITLPTGEEEWRKTGENHGMDCAVGCLAAAWRYEMYLKASLPAAAPAGHAETRQEMRTPDGRPWNVRDR
ncbi:MAG TPA: phage terminase large subunit family protein [Planctomycetota bacterium]|nr:phage terminase large subunit family protein [Planctomycetota bacterium]